MASPPLSPGGGRLFQVAPFGAKQPELDFLLTTGGQKIWCKKRKSLAWQKTPAISLSCYFAVDAPITGYEVAQLAKKIPGKGLTAYLMYFQGL